MLTQLYNRHPRAMKKIMAWYRARLKKRHAAEFETRWSPYGGVNQKRLHEWVSIHELPTPYIYPTDRLELFLYNPYMDFRDAETYRLLETILKQELTERDLVRTLSGYYMRDILAAEQ